MNKKLFIYSGLVGLGGLLIHLNNIVVKKRIYRDLAEYISFQTIINQDTTDEIESIKDEIGCVYEHLEELSGGN